MPAHATLLLILPALLATDVQLKAPERVEPHTLVRLSLDGLPPDASAIWDVYPFAAADIAELDGGTACVFTGPPGRYGVSATYFADGRLQRAGRATVLIGDDPTPIPPTPIPPGPTPPGPNPPTPPVPPTPDGLQARLAAALADVDEPGKAARSADLARRYDGLASQVAAGTLRSPDDLIAEFVQEGRDSLGVAALSWAPWIKAVAAEIDAAGTLEGKADVLRAAAGVLAPASGPA